LFEKALLHTELFLSILPELPPPDTKSFCSLVVNFHQMLQIVTTTIASVLFVAVACWLLHICTKGNRNITRSFVEWFLNSEWSVSNLVGCYALSLDEYLHNYLPTDM